MSNRRIDAFFYGLFMDGDLLRKAGVEPTNPRRAYVDGFALRIGQRATLVPSAGDRAYGSRTTEQGAPRRFRMNVVEFPP